MMDTIGGFAGGLAGLLLVGGLLALVLVWIAVPFILMGISRRMDDLLKLAERATGSPPGGSRVQPTMPPPPPPAAPGPAVATRSGPVPPWERPTA